MCLHICDKVVVDEEPSKHGLDFAGVGARKNRKNTVVSYQKRSTE